MAGATLQLSLYGNQDVLITGAPQVTFFKQVYRRHTHFAMQSVEQIFQSTADFGKKAPCPISKSGDLLNTVWLQITLPALSDYRFDTAQTPTATMPAIVSARWASSTTATVTVAPPTDSFVELEGSVERYCVTLDPGNGSNVTAFYSATGGTTVTITGLDSTVAYTVTAKREQVLNDAVQDSSDESEAMTIESLRWTDSIGHALMEYVELDVGGVRIDRHESDFMDILGELSTPEEKKSGFETMIGKYPDYDLYDNSFQESRTMYVPLQFSFCKSPGMSIPLVSLAYHNVTLTFKFRDYTELVRSTASVTSLTHMTTGAAPSMTVRLYASFVLLDTTERRRFTSVPHDYLIEQCQFLGDKPVLVDANNPNLNKKIDMNFSHPVKEIIWVYNYSNTYNSNISSSQYSTLGNDYFNYDLPGAYAGEDPIVDAKLQLNGHDRTDARPAKYFRLVQPYQHHTRIPNKKIYTFSYALHPEDFQPSGTCNYSRVDTAHLVLNMNPAMLTDATKGRIRLFAINYNVFKVVSGMGGLSFSGA
jgi:Large eukaryotic DNA virus major capsid protein/Major capsid protein N-terminus